MLTVLPTPIGPTPIGPIPFCFCIYTNTQKSNFCKKKGKFMHKDKNKLRKGINLG
jgi:hypothetical protein